MGTQTRAEERNCLVCNVVFKVKSHPQVCCSKNCHYIYKFGSLPYTKDDVINIIINLATKTSSTPQKRDCERRLNCAAIRFFGTWNKTMKACGLKPNNSKYQRTRLKCLDGHMADSISERIIDNWFFKNQIRHERSKIYPNSKKINCDFYLVDFNLWVEYFGLCDSSSQEYEETMKTKKEIVKDNNLNFVALVPEDLYNDNKISYSDKLDKIFGKYVNYGHVA